MTALELPIRRVGRDARVTLLGHYLPDARVLRLAEPGFPLLGPGEHRLDGELPWVFQDMAPAGFLARRFAGWYPELHLEPDSRLWSAADVLTAISERGHDLPGNLVVGERSWERFDHVFAHPLRAEARLHYADLASDVITASGAPSSVGGERPKFALRLGDGSGLLVKFTPPLSSPFGPRWADLLRFEAHCLATLRAAGLPAVVASYVELDDRGYLEVDRFDRLPGGGRVGAVTLFWLGASRYGEAGSLPDVARHLRAEGWITAGDETMLRRVHAFSAAIGNTDAHLGNYALTIGDDGAVGLAPFFDVLPMAFAPRHDELPDAHLLDLSTAAAPDVRPLVTDLVERVTADASISRPLVERWRRHIGA